MQYSIFRPAAPGRTPCNPAGRHSNSGSLQSGAQGRSRPQRASRLLARAIEEVQLVESSGQPDGSILYVFGSASEAEAAKKAAEKSNGATQKGAAQAEAKPAAPSPAPAKEGPTSGSSAESRSSNGVATAPISDREIDHETDYEAMTVLDLRHLCREKKITGFSNYRKAELIDALQSSDKG
ncbi:hypothetical protein WJX73_000511 [Symbiochloris irregularis]|uniref:Rho termination factor-like N-terminal domain-containing protein n=1 Tax=Symbiochloris irregularis TaxID=706552 RepID=A0AAW1NX86_9CHLO